MGSTYSNADGREEQADISTAATDVIDSQTTISFPKTGPPNGSNSVPLGVAIDSYKAQLLL